MIRLHSSFVRRYEYSISTVRAPEVWAIQVPKAKVVVAERAILVGIVEVNDQHTRFVPISDRRKLAGAESDCRQKNPHTENEGPRRLGAQ
jgi:hypothetical protein